MTTVTLCTRNINSTLNSLFPLTGWFDQQASCSRRSSERAVPMHKVDIASQCAGSCPQNSVTCRKKTIACIGENGQASAGPVDHSVIAL